MPQRETKSGKRLTDASRLVGLLAMALVAGSARGAAPEGGLIAFEGDRFGGWSLSAMTADGSRIVHLGGPVGAADASWSPNGKRVAFEADPHGDGDLEVFVMNADGTDIRQLTDSPGPDYWPGWFPDGRRIAFTSLRTGVPNLYVMDADGSNQRAVTDEVDFASVQPDVAPDGQRIVFQRESTTAPPTLWVIGADGSGAHPVLAPGPWADIDPQWSPDGRTLVFSSNRVGTFEIFSLGADGAVTQLTASAGGDFNPTFAPDGQRIAWWKLRGGQGDVWTMNRDGSGQVNVTDSPAFEGFPDWHQGHLGAK